MLTNVIWMKRFGIDWFICVGLTCMGWFGLLGALYAYSWAEMPYCIGFALVGILAFYVEILHRSSTSLSDKQNEEG